MAVREVRGVHLGRLITVRGIVTRVSEVKPLLLVNAYTCDSCGSELFEDIASKQFTPLRDCQSDVCLANSTKGSLHMQTRACRFSAFQEVKIQEMVSGVIWLTSSRACSKYYPLHRPTKFPSAIFLARWSSTYKAI